jgi:hypothetical protein
MVCKYTLLDLIQLLCIISHLFLRITSVARMTATTLVMGTVNDNMVVGDIILHDEVLTSKVATTRFPPSSY